MGFVDEPALEPGEQVLERWSANRTQGWRAVGGRLFVTTTHLRFRPNVVDRNTAGRSWDAPRSAVAGTGLADRDPVRGFLAGGLRRRLEITLSDGTVERFVVNGAEAKAALLRR